MKLIHMVARSKARETHKDVGRMLYRGAENAEKRVAALALMPEKTFLDHDVGPMAELDPMYREQLLRSRFFSGLVNLSRYVNRTTYARFLVKMEPNDLEIGRGEHEESVRKAARILHNYLRINKEMRDSGFRDALGKMTEGRETATKIKQLLGITNAVSLVSGDNLGNYMRVYGKLYRGLISSMGRRRAANSEIMEERTTFVRMLGYVISKKLIGEIVGHHGIKVKKTEIIEIARKIPLERIGDMQLIEYCLERLNIHGVFMMSKGILDSHYLTPEESWGISARANPVSDRFVPYALRNARKMHMGKLEEVAAEAGLAGSEIKLAVGKLNLTSEASSEIIFNVIDKIGAGELESREEVMEYVQSFRVQKAKLRQEARLPERREFKISKAGLQCVGTLGNFGTSAGHLNRTFGRFEEVIFPMLTEKYIRDRQKAQDPGVRRLILERFYAALSEEYRKLRQHGPKVFYDFVWKRKGEILYRCCKEVLGEGSVAEKTKPVETKEKEADYKMPETTGTAFPADLGGWLNMMESETHTIGQTDIVAIKNLATHALRGNYDYDSVVRAVEHVIMAFFCGASKEKRTNLEEIKGFVVPSRLSPFVGVAVNNLIARDLLEKYRKGGFRRINYRIPGESDWVRTKYGKVKRV